MGSTASNFAICERTSKLIIISKDGTDCTTPQPLNWYGQEGNHKCCRPIHPNYILPKSENWTLTSKERQMLTTTEMTCLKLQERPEWIRSDTKKLDGMYNMYANSIANSKQERDQVVMHSSR